MGEREREKNLVCIVHRLQEESQGSPLTTLRTSTHEGGAPSVTSAPVVSCVRFRIRGVIGRNLP